ncbi:hypothetical protein [Enterococcus italicus]
MAYRYYAMGRLRRKMLPKIADKLFISDYPQIIAGIGCFVEKQMEQ